MKNYSNLFLLVLLVIFSGCNKDGFKIFDADVKLSKSFDVDVPAEAPLMTVTFRHNFDATTDPEIKNIVDRIDRYKVKSVSYSISEYSGEPTILEEGVITVKSDDGRNLGTVTLTNVDLQALNNAGEQVLPFEASEINDIEAALKDNNKLNMIFTTTIDNKPVAFKLKTFIDLNVEYRVFD